MLLALCISWLFCFVLTVTDVLPAAPTGYGHLARTDAKGSVLSQAPWFRFPYPGNEKMGPLYAWDTFPRTIRAPRALDGELSRAVGEISKESDKGRWALGSPDQTPKRRRRPSGGPKHPLGVLDHMLLFPDLPPSWPTSLSPSSMLPRTCTSGSGERMGGSHLLAKGLGHLLDLLDPTPGRLETEHFWGDLVKAIP